MMLSLFDLETYLTGVYMVIILVWGSCCSFFWVPYCDVRYDFRIDDVQFVFTSSCLWEGSCFIYVICVCLRILVSNTYCAVFLFCLSSSCVPYVASFSLDCPFFILYSLTFVYRYGTCTRLSLLLFNVPLWQGQQNIFHSTSGKV